MSKSHCTFSSDKHVLFVWLPISDIKSYFSKEKWTIWVSLHITFVANMFCSDGCWWPINLSFCVDNKWTVVTTWRSKVFILYVLTYLFFMQNLKLIGQWHMSKWNIFVTWVMWIQALSCLFFFSNIIHLTIYWCPIILILNIDSSTLKLTKWIT